MLPARDLHQHAEEIRALAEQIKETDLRLKMLGIAGDIDRYATRKEAASVAKAKSRSSDA